jgi:hypothetical protein
MAPARNRQDGRAWATAPEHNVGAALADLLTLVLQEARQGGYEEEPARIDRGLRAKMAIAGDIINRYRGGAAEED